MLLVLTIVLLLLDLYPIFVLAAVIILFPYKSIWNFKSYEKSVHTKGRTMGLIAQVGLKYHLAVIAGLLIAIKFR